MRRWAGVGLQTEISWPLGEVSNLCTDRLAPAMWPVKPTAFNLFPLPSALRLRTTEQSKLPFQSLCQTFIIPPISGFSENVSQIFNLRGRANLGALRIASGHWFCRPGKGHVFHLMLLWSRTTWCWPFRFVPTPLSTDIIQGKDKGERTGEIGAVYGSWRGHRRVYTPSKNICFNLQISAVLGKSNSWNTCERRAGSHDGPL